LLTSPIGVDHPQGAGKLVATPCNVVFYLFIPESLIITPYILLTSFGKHSHPPPPPNKPPESIIQEIVELVKYTKDPGLTTGNPVHNVFLTRS
jgi:hypothetical protein